MKKSRWSSLTALSVLLLFLLGFYTQIHYAPQTAKLHRGLERSTVDMPYKDQSALTEEIKSETVGIYFKWEHAWHVASKIRIIPDDCAREVRINGRQFLLDDVPEESLCDHRNGFTLDLSDYLRNGTNRISVQVQDYGGAVGLKIVPSPWDWRLMIWGVMVLGVAGLLLYRIGVSLGFPLPLRVLLVVAVMIQVLYLNVTDYDVRSHDVPGHVDYIEHVAEHGSLPSAKACWQCYQPPVYYTVAGAVDAVVKVIDSSVDMAALQLLSMVFFLLFLIYGFRILQFYLQGRTLVLAAALMVSLPTSVLHAVRLGNDVALYAFSAMSLFYLIRWMQSLENKDAYLAAGISLLALLSKSNGLVIVVVVGLSMLWFSWKNGMLKQQWKLGVKVALMLVMGIGLSVGQSMVRGGDEVVGNLDTLNNKLYVGNNPINYLKLDMQRFVQKPITDPWKDGYGRHFFWEYLLKTSLYGEFRADYNGAQKVVAHFSSMMFIGVLGLMLVGLITLRPLALMQMTPLLITGVLFLMALISLRVSVPASCSNDYRYILPILLPFVILVGYGVEWLRRTGYPVLSFFAQGVVIVFCALGVTFIIAGVL